MIILVIAGAALLAGALFVAGMRKAARSCIKYVEWTDNMPDARSEISTRRTP